MKAPRKSKVLEKLRAGETVVSFKTNMSCSRSAEIAGIAGYDCLWVCNEHVPGDYLSLERQILAAKAYDMDTVVRVPRGSYSDLIKPLELDASGIMVPHVMNVEEARQIVRNTRFFPIGRRPADGGNADGQFCALPFAEYIKFTNENRFVMIQIEDPETLEDIEDICSLDGIDIIFFGPGDYSQGIGAPGQLDHPEVQRARELVVETALKHGKFAGTTSTPATFKKYEEMGYRFLNIGADVVAITQYCGNIMKTLGRDGGETGGVYGGK
jgi:4-hydroxy-2-oxoheptanedioate aldolase